MKVEYEERKKDLEKITGLEEKIQRELKNTSEKLETLQSEISTKFNNHDSVKKEY